MIPKQALIAKGYYSSLFHPFNLFNTKHLMNVALLVFTYVTAWFQHNNDSFTSAGGL